MLTDMSWVEQESAGDRKQAIEAEASAQFGKEDRAATFMDGKSADNKTWAHAPGSHTLKTKLSCLPQASHEQCLRICKKYAQAPAHNVSCTESPPFLMGCVAS
eukprot:1160240-Pelagomonas_calceolata.AAC.2